MLVNTAEFDSVPVTRIIDVPLFTIAMLEVCGEFEASHGRGGGSITASLLLVRKTLKLLKQYVKPGVVAKIPGLFGLLDTKLREHLSDLLNACQVLILIIMRSLFRLNFSCVC